MKVMVRYDDDNYDIIEDYCLEYLILTGNITAFCRSDKWVEIGIDPTREEGFNSDKYRGPERRKTGIKDRQH